MNGINLGLLIIPDELLILPLMRSIFESVEWAIKLVAEFVEDVHNFVRKIL